MPITNHEEALDQGAALLDISDPLDSRAQGIACLVALGPRIPTIIVKRERYNPDTRIRCDAEVVLPGCRLKVR